MAYIEQPFPIMEDPRFFDYYIKDNGYIPLVGMSNPNEVLPSVTSASAIASARIVSEEPPIIYAKDGTAQYDKTPLQTQYYATQNTQQRGQEAASTVVSEPAKLFSNISAGTILIGAMALYLFVQKGG